MSNKSSNESTDTTTHQTRHETHLRRAERMTLPPLLYSLLVCLTERLCTQITRVSSRGGVPARITKCLQVILSKGKCQGEPDCLAESEHGKSVRFNDLV